MYDNRKYVALVIIVFAILVENQSLNLFRIRCVIDHDGGNYSHLKKVQIKYFRVSEESLAIGS